jgi:uncharacterized protein
LPRWRLDATARSTRPSHLQCYVGMEVVDTAVLLAAGLAAGTVNAIAGGGSFITFPTLVAIGLPPVPANVTNSIAVSPGYLASVYGARVDLVALADSRGRRSLYALLPTVVVGTAIGSLLLLATPARAFELVVPFLLLAAAGVLAFGERLGGVVRRGSGTHSTRTTIALHATVGVASVYGGYFGAAMGVVLVAALALVLDETLARVSALKNAVSAVVGLVTVVAFALFGPVDWAAVAVLAPATLIGGYAGARLAGRLPARVLRGVVVAVGLTVGVVLLVRAF